METNDQVPKKSMFKLLDDVELLMLHAIERGIELDESEVEPVVAYRREMNSSAPIGEKTESSFCAAAARIASKVRPSTAAGLRLQGAYESNSTYLQIARSAKFYRILTWAVILIIVIVHAVYIILNGWIEKSESSYSAGRDYQRQIVAVALPSAAIEKGLPGTEDQVSLRGRREAAEQIINLSFDYCRSVSDGFVYVRKIPFSRMFADTEYAEIAWFASCNSTSKALGNSLGAEVVSSNLPTPLTDGDVIEMARAIKSQTISRPVMSARSARVLSDARDVRIVLVQFILPALYGWLGALALVVRSISDSITNSSFSTSTSVVYSLRLPLGTLAGITVGFLFQQDRLASVPGLTALGLAFGAGYSVEIFLSALDGLIGRLSGVSHAGEVKGS